MHRHFTAAKELFKQYMREYKPDDIAAKNHIKVRGSSSWIGWPRCREV
jgi:hypothetical protein